ncbi:mycothiol system anti-sigma-R factor [Streptomyces sp. NPDC003077]|uniref:mycothiol system anti-sigma-R factor n=1 Tax=Streptomyces sp. NPDC003077 TaxID=3154443 RepID=UPI0033BD31EB
MSCGEPHEKACADILDHLYEYLDHEMPAGESEKFQVHFDECSPCLEMYGLEEAVKKLVKRCCGHDDVPTDLRSKVMSRIELIQAGEAVPEQGVLDEARREQAARDEARHGEPAASAAEVPVDARSEAARAE